MGLITGVYDAKEGSQSGGFVPGGASMHNCMSGHGPDAASYEKAVAADTTAPHHVTDTMAFMFETRAVIKPTKQALESKELQAGYYECWQDIKQHFDPKRR
jgi:homogentisate 1,2-dioxygenase